MSERMFTLFLIGLNLIIWGVLIEWALRRYG